MEWMGFSEAFDVLVVRARHARCEAAVASARMGLRTAIFVELQQQGIDFLLRSACL
jgi:tRNA U34 5-carboxymethylaminomethyl modifying enzyme MnmG/GidA